MKRKLFTTLLFLSLSGLIVAFVDSPYARRIRPFTTVPTSCAENEVGYSMTLHKLYICKNTGYVEVGGFSGGAITSPLLGPDGTAALPTYSFSNDSDTGMFRSGTNSIGFTTNGVEKWVINSSGAFNPVLNNTYDIGNGVVNPRDINVGRNIILGGTLNGNTFTAGTFTLTGGAGKTLLFNNTLTLSGTDGSTLNVGTGGTLGTNAFLSTVFAPLTSPTFLGTVTIPTGAQITKPNIIGTATNDNAATGSVGEYVEASAAIGSVSLVNDTPKTIISISLTAGDWDVSGVILYNPAATTNSTNFVSSISQTNNVNDQTLGRAVNNTYGAGSVTGTSVTHVLPTVRKSLSSTTTIYLVGYDAFTISTVTAGGIITARRVY